MAPRPGATSRLARATRALRVAALLLLASFAPLQAQQAARGEGRALVIGWVGDTDQAPIAGAVVWVVGSSRYVRTDSTGRFVLGEVPVGLQVIAVQKLGYKPHYFNVTLVDQQRLGAEVVLAHQAAALDTVRITARGERWTKPSRLAYTTKFDGFYERRATAVGDFMTREQLARTGSFTLANALEGQIGGLQSRTIGGHVDIRFGLCQGNGVQVYVDGRRVTNSAVPAG
ncbi:MAG TPA: carboxypeptidase regulatory-like domain-containing protein, partial [Gemmatimonadaceae bacterium]|nr:carboxypeptidase regulatory-like domain-containing protein [Gemmatimonadaceae bacterium]